MLLLPLPLMLMMIPNLDGGLIVLVRLRPFLVLYLHLQFPQQTKREKTGEMLKRVRKVVMDPSPSSSSPLPVREEARARFKHQALLPSSPLPVREEARARFKHQALLQDYEDLLRETEAKKRKLQKYMQKKLKLMAEVKFLRKKYNSFTRNSSQEAPFRLKKLPRKKPSPSVTFVHPEHSINNANDNANHPLQEENHRAKETETPATSALFDLNKVSFSNAEEMEGIQVEWEPLKVDKLKRCSADGEVAAGRDLNLSIFKDVGNSSSHVGKRKISWQDQVALRV